MQSEGAAKLIFRESNIRRLERLYRENQFPGMSFIAHLREYVGAEYAITAEHGDCGFVTISFPVNPTTGWHGWSFQMHKTWIEN